MTDLVSLLLLLRSLLILKLQMFPYTCLFTLFVTIIIFGELTSVTSATSNKRMTTDIIFAGATPIN